MKSKALKRIKLISSNAMRQVLVSLFGMMIPFFVILFSSKEIWGAFVSIVLYTLFAIQIINWGNKEYLLREFSSNPSKIKYLFSSNFKTRLSLVLLFSFIAFIFFSIEYIFFISLWLLGRFLYHSTEPLLFFEKKFNTYLYIEIITFALFSIALYQIKYSLTNFKLVAVYSIYQLIKGFISLYVFRQYIVIKNIQIEISFYKKALPFFLLSLMGFLISKSDVYLVEYFCDDITTGNYQILNSLLVFIISISVFIYSPFTKNIYRNQTNTIKKYQKLMSLSGLIIIPIALMFTYFLIQTYLQLNLSIWFYILSFLYIYPSYIYGIQIIKQFAEKKEKKVIEYLFYSALTNIIFSALFLYLGYGIMGALMGACLSQILALYLFSIKVENEN